MNLFQAGALVATSLQQAVNKSISEATPVLQDFWGARAKATGARTPGGEPSWKPFGGAQSALEGGLSALQRRNSDALEKQKAEEAIKLLQSQVSCSYHLPVAHSAVQCKGKLH